MIKNFSCVWIFLSSGNPIKAQTILTPTLEHYIRIAGTCANVHTSYDPTKAGDKKYIVRNEISLVIRAVIQKHHRWESVPNRREPVTKKMDKWWLKNMSATGPDTFNAAMTDWIVLGSQLGMCKLEWNQPNKYKKANSKFEPTVDGSSKTFILDDFKLIDSSASTISKHDDTKIKKENS